MAITEICPKSKCTGCSACASSCGTKAIEMVPDGMGYIFPRINSLTCVECGRCIKVCPVNYPVERNQPDTVYALHCKDHSDWDASASGGAATLASQIIIGLGGVVYGCIQQNCTDIKHERIDSFDNLNKLRGSKYVQSLIGDNYKRCRTDLKEGKPVLFIGTPCQIAGLYNFLGREYSNLITMDLVCHGVPSMKILNDNIELIKRRQNIFTPSSQFKVTFRKKLKKPLGIRYGFYLNEEGSDFPNDYYISAFIFGLTFRENCFTCPYANSKRVGDITVGDFWGLGRTVNSSMNENEGISEVFLNTPKGKDFFSKLQDYCEYELRNIEEAVKGNGQLMKPSTMPKDYFRFKELYISFGYERACKKILPKYIKKYYLRTEISKIKLAIRQLAIIGPIAVKLKGLLK